MRVKVISRLGDAPVVMDAAVVLVENQFGEPISVACSNTDGVFWLAHCKDKNFNDVLRMLGIDKTIIAADVRGASLPAGAKLLTPLM